MKNTVKLKFALKFIKRNNIKYFKIFNILVTQLTTSPQYEYLSFANTKEVSFTNPFTNYYYVILITKF
jgi:hypothetical protein